MQTGRDQEILGTIAKLHPTEGRKSFRLLLDVEDEGDVVCVAVVGRFKKRDKKNKWKKLDAWPLEEGDSLLVSGYVRRERHRVDVPYTVRARTITNVA